jgi:radical SAM superfamily enzyme YgiQ (UPF0313 family)
MIYLVQINFSQDHSEKILPLGPLSVASALKRHGVKSEIININERDLDKTAEYLVKQRSEFIGISVMTGIQTYHSALLSKKIKELNRNIPIIWGGIHPSLLSEQCIREEYIDYVCIGEGEDLIVEFVEYLAGKKQQEAILGFAYKDPGGVKITKSRPLINNLDDYPVDLTIVDLNKYIFKLGPYERTIAYKSSRGCPYNCAFCYNHLFNQNRWRCWSTEKVVSDIKYLKEKYRINAIKFYDDNFFVDEKRAYEILERIGIPAHIEVRIDRINDEVAAKLKKFNCYDLLIGIESGSNRVLNLMSKGITVDKIFDGVKALARQKLTASYSAIVGLPTETKAEFKSTIKLLYDVYQIHPQARFTMGAYLPYPGSKLYDFSISQGFKQPAKTEDWGRVDRFRKEFDSPWVNTKKVWVIREYFKFLSLDLGPIKKWLALRIKYQFWFFPFEVYLLEWLSNIAIDGKGLIGKSLRSMYNLIRNKKFA